MCFWKAVHLDTDDEDAEGGNILSKDLLAEKQNPHRNSHGIVATSQWTRLVVVDVECPKMSDSEVGAMVRGSKAKMSTESDLSCFPDLDI